MRGTGKGAKNGSTAKAKENAKVTRSKKTPIITLDADEVEER